MIETFSIPILMKAVDFLFEEGQKILQERRERRKAERSESSQLSDAPAAIKDSSESQIVNIASEEAIDSKDEALKQKVDEAIWKKSEAEVKHLLSLLEIHTRNYYLAKEQYSKWGSALVPPVIIHNLTEAEDEMEATTGKLLLVLSKIYGKQVLISK